MNKNKFIKYTVGFGVLFSSVLLGSASASAACTLTNVGPTASSYINGNNYGYTVDFTSGDTCGDDGVIITGYYLYDSDDDGDFTDEGPFQQFAQVSPLINNTSYTLNWDTTARTDGDNTRYKSRVILTGGGAGSMTPLSTFGIDNTAPTISTVKTLDLDKDGKIDAVKITYTDAGSINSNIKDSTVVPSDFSISGYTVGQSLVAPGTVSGDGLDDNVIVISFTEGGAPDTDATPDLTYTAGSLTDSYTSGNSVLTAGPITSTDGAEPIMLSVANYDVFNNTQNGKNDEFYLTFSEPIDDSTLGAYTDFLIDSDRDGVYEISGTKKGGTIYHGQTDAANDQYVSIMMAMESTHSTNVGVEVLTGAIADAAGVVTTNQFIAYDAVSGNTDAAGPGILSATTTGTGTVRLTLSEVIGKTQLLNGDFTLTGTELGDSTVTSVESTGTGNTVDVSITGDISLAFTSTGNVVAFTSAGLVDDLYANTNGQTSNIIITDGIAPVVSSATTSDSDSNGKIDTLTVVYSENVTDTGAYMVGTGDTNPGITVSGYDVSSIDGGNGTDTIVYVLEEGTLADTNATPTVTYTPANIKDTANNNLSTTTGTAIDGAGPAIVSATSKTSTTLDLTFSEPIDDSTASGSSFILDFTDNNTDGTGSVFTTGTANDNVVTLTVASGTIGNAETTGTVAFTSAGLVADSGSLNTNTQTATITVADGIVPTVTSAITSDSDSNGKIDTLTVVYSENVTDTGSYVSGTGDTNVGLVVTGYDITAKTGSNTGTLVYTLAESGSADTSVTPSLTFDGANIKDASNNDLSTTSFSSTDGAGPAIVSAITTNSGTVSVTFSEGVASGSLDLSDIDFSGFPTGGANGTPTDSGSNDADNIITFTLPATIGASETGVVILTGTAVITDLVGNDNTQDSIDITVTDGIAPVVTSATTSDNNSNGKIDRLTVVYDEAVTSTLSGVSVDGYPVTSLTGSSTDTIVYTLTESGSVDTGITPSLSYSGTYIKDLANNELSTTSGTAIDGAKPVATTVTFSNNPANATGDTTVTVVMSEDVSIAPNIDIDQQGLTDITAVLMTGVTPIDTFTYDYDVNTHDGTTYKDGLAYVGLSLASDGTNVMDTVSTASGSTFTIQTVSINTTSVHVDNNNPKIDENVVISGIATANVGTSSGARLVITNQLDSSTCSIDLGTGVTSDGAFGSSVESLSYSLDLNGSATCTETGAVSDFVTSGKQYKLSLVGKDSIAGNWEAIDTDNSLIITVNPASAVVYTAPTILSITTDDTSYLTGETASITVTTTGATTGLDIITSTGATVSSGSTANSYTLSVPVGNVTGLQSLQVIAINNTATTTQNISLAVNNPTFPAPIISTVSTNSGAYVVGENAIFTVVTETGASVTVSNLAGTITGSLLEDNGTYTGTVSVGAITGSQTYEVTVTKNSSTSVKYITLTVSSSPVTPVLPTVTLTGATIDSAYTLSGANARFIYGLQFEVTNDSIVTVNGTTVSSLSGVVIAANNASAKTLGAHTYHVIVTSTTGHTATITVSYQVNADYSDTTAPVISAINTQVTGTTTADYNFITNETSTGVIYVGTGSDVTTTLITSSTTVGTTHTGSFTGLNPSTTYYYYIVATDTSGNPTTTQNGTFTTNAVVLDTTAPTISQYYILDIANTTAGFTFKTNETASGVVSITNNAGTEIWSGSTDGTSHTGSITGLVANTLYNVEITATDASSNSRSVSTQFRTIDYGMPEVSNIAFANITNSSVNLSWENDSSSFSGEYMISTSNTFAGATWTGATVSGTGASKSITGLLAGKTYYIKVKNTKNGKSTTYSYISFKTATSNTGIVVNNIQRVIHGDVAVGADYGSGYHFRFTVTANNMNESTTSFKLADWTNGLSTIAVSGNTKMAISSEGFADYASATGSLVDVTNNYGVMQNVSSIDADASTGGRQYVIDVFYKIPAGAGGAYTTSYGIKTENPSS